MNKLFLRISALILLVISFNVYADYKVVKGKYGELAVTLNLKTAGFAEANPWFGQAHENIGNAANFWWEGSVEAGTKASINSFGGTELYGAYSYLVGLSAKPVKTLDMHLFYYHFNIDQPESLAKNVTAHNFADEVDLIADWQATESLSISAVLAVAIPNEAARQFTGGGNTWFHSMLYAEWAL
ncbi:secreted protein [methanotrophic bacterial endosymbiont of Bathymodiolus sp.]|nr:secreted protein [methanotrophic bacterial endosymbiont of Bathymodiolus sp.]